MIFFPAIDLVAGQVVRLRRGDRSQMDVYSSDPVAVARDFCARGASWIHVVDLSAALGEDQDACDKNARAIAGICGVEGVSVDTGGGVRDAATLERLVDMGCSRVAIGTALVRDPDFARVAARDFAEFAVADVAAKDGMVRVNGWREGAETSAEELVGSLAELGFRHLVFTDVSRDGMQCGIDVESYVHIAGVAGFPVVASGGIASLDDVRALAAAGDDVIEGAISGRAIFEGSFTLEDALAAAS